VKPISWRIQLTLVAAGYAAVVAVSIILILFRMHQYARNAADVAASGGMWAGGDLILEILICFLFLVPTIALMMVIGKSESASTIYAKVLLGFSLTAPLSVVTSFIPALNQSFTAFDAACVFRLFAMPMVVIFLTLSRLWARFARTRRLISYALLVEALTCAFMIAMLFLPFKGHRG
jgi:hypothetical protein